MISKADLQRLLDREPTGRPVLSLFLDMSVNSDNKRTFGVFLGRLRSTAGEAANGGDARMLEAALDRIEQWIETEYDETKRGVAAFAELGGDWFEVLQFRARIQNRKSVGPYPAVAPLVQILSRYHHHGVLLVDREHLRMLSLYMGQTVSEQEVKTEPYPAPHDVQRGGYSARDFQSRKAEEVKHFFKEFAQEAAAFQRKHRPDDLIVLGTDENVKHFLEFLPQELRGRVVHTDHAAIDATSAEVVERLDAFLRRQEDERRATAVDTLRDRVENDHYASAGFQRTLEQLQEGKVQTLVVGEDLERAGVRCTQCGFYLAATNGACPYCGGETHDGIDLVETMVRLAAGQNASVEFTNASTLHDMDGVGALLKF